VQFVCSSKSKAAVHGIVGKRMLATAPTNAPDALRLAHAVARQAVNLAKFVLSVLL